MSIKFSDPALFVKGTLGVTRTDPVTGDIVGYSDKVDSSTWNFSVDEGIVRGGFLNPIVTMLPSQADVTWECNTVDFSIGNFAAQIGAETFSGGPKMVCQDVTATGATLTVSMAKGTPVARLGMTEPVAYVQVVGDSSPIVSAGAAYPIDSAGVVTGFNATAGVTYKVWYFVNRANAQGAMFTTAPDGRVELIDVEMAVFTNINPDTQSGTRIGTLYMSALMKFNPGGSFGGNQTDVATTTVTARAIPNDAAVVTAGCDDCAGTGTPLAYFLYIPCDPTEGLNGLALVGGVIDVAAGAVHNINEFRLVGRDNSLIVPDPAFMSYTVTPDTLGTVSGSTFTAGTTAGDGEIVATYTDGDTTFTCPANLSVTTA